MQQQQRALDDAIREAVCQKNASWAREAGLDLEDFDRKLTAVMEQCTKEAIAVSCLPQAERFLHSCTKCTIVYLVF